MMSPSVDVRLTVPDLSNATAVSRRERSSDPKRVRWAPARRVAVAVSPMAPASSAAPRQIVRTLIIKVCS